MREKKSFLVAKAFGAGFEGVGATRGFGLAQGHALRRAIPRRSPHVSFWVESLRAISKMHPSLTLDPATATQESTL